MIKLKLRCIFKISTSELSPNSHKFDIGCGEILDHGFIFYPYLVCNLGIHTIMTNIASYVIITQFLLGSICIVLLVSFEFSQMAINKKQTRFLSAKLLRCTETDRHAN